LWRGLVFNTFKLKTYDFKLYNLGKEGTVIRTGTPTYMYIAVHSAARAMTRASKLFLAHCYNLVFLFMHVGDRISLN
jgi:hypothetical protein